MPVIPTYPGVYIQEVPSGVRTITSVATSIAAFLGRATKGPINKAVRILSLSDYERQLGEPFAKSDLASSVKHFFNNGGTDCYVIRLAKDADPASVTLQSLGGQEVLDVTAKAEGLWGNTVRMEISYNTPNPDETFNLAVIQEEAGNIVRTEKFINLSMDTSSARYAPSFVSQSSELITLELSATDLGDTTDATSTYNMETFAGISYGRRPLVTNDADVQTTLNTLIGTGKSKFQISVNGSAYVTVDLATDSIAGDIPTVIAGMINDALATLSPVETVSCSIAEPDPDPGIGRMLTITSTSGDLSSVRVKRATNEDISVALMLGVDQGGIEQVRWSNFRPAPTATMLRLGNPPATPGDMTIANGVAAMAQTAIRQITVDGETIQLNTTDYNLETNTGNPWYRNAAGKSTATGDNDGVREKLKIMADAINNSANLACKAEVWGYHLAIIPKDGTINKQIAITSETRFDDGITGNVRLYSLGTAGTGGFSINGVDGDDGGAPEYDDYIGSESAQTGFHALDAVDLFNLMILPEDEEVGESLMLSLWGPASTYCESRRAFLLVDAPASWTNSSTGRPDVVNDTSKISDLRVSIVKDHAAVFYPRLRYSDSGVTKTIASAGAIAGLMARTDANRGVWKAPAGIEAGIRNVLGLNVELTDAENGVLNKKGVNCIRVFPNGIVNWGSRTLDGDDDFGSEWKYIPVRRLALNIEESLYRGTRWVVFESNDEPLWAKIRLNVGTYMMSLFRQGAFQGSNPKEAFFVKCDKETTTQDDINKGIVNIRVGFAPLKPAEFVVITIQQMAGEL